MATPFDPAFTALILRIRAMGYRVSGGQSHDKITITATSRTGERHVVTYFDGTDSESAKRAARELATQVGLTLDE